MQLTPSMIPRLDLNQLASLYLGLSYGYYIEMDSLVEDGVYDAICKRLHDEFDKVTHVHKDRINIGDLEAGTCLLTRMQYPVLVRMSYDYFARQMLHGDLVSGLLEKAGISPPPPPRSRARRAAPAPEAVQPAARVSRRRIVAPTTQPPAVARVARPRRK